jgi:tetratricopeptide (TPR) repeat protein
MFAILNSGKIIPFIKPLFQPSPRPKRITLRHFPILALILFCLGCISTGLRADDAPNPVFVQRAEKAFLAAKARLNTATNNPDALWLFSRAAYDWADLQTTDARRKDIAEQGIAADRQLIAADPGSVEGHYYLGMNLGELAMTETLGALKLVREMESEFILVLHTNAAFDNAGPDRNLGLLYRDAPGWPASIGNRAKAREHLQKAVVLTPGFPENLLNLIEAELKWSEPAQALHDLKTLDDLWPKSRQQYTGEAWELSWTDWNKRRNEAHKKTGAAAAETTASSPHNK